MALIPMERYTARPADGVTEVIHAVRDELRKGQTSSRSWCRAESRLRVIRSSACSFERMRSKLSARKRRDGGTYVAAHAYSATAIKHAVGAGVRTIEHGNCKVEPGELPRRVELPDRVVTGSVRHGHRLVRNRKVNPLDGQARESPSREGCHAEAEFGLLPRRRASPPQSPPRHQSHRSARQSRAWRRPWGNRGAADARRPQPAHARTVLEPPL